MDHPVTAIFAPILKLATTRLKLLLKDNIHLLDGYRNSDVHKLVSNFKLCNYFVEADLEKQDRQTDNVLLEF